MLNPRAESADWAGRPFRSAQDMPGAAGLNARIGKGAEMFARLQDGAAADVTHRRVLGIAVPIMVSNATVPILGAVDVAVVGQLGEAAPIGAVGIGSIILTTVYWMFGFLRMGTTGLVSQARGKRDQPEVSAFLSRVLVFGLAAGAALVAFQLPLFWTAFQIAPASQEVERLAGEYGRIRILSAPAAIAIYGITGWLIALERTRSVLLVQLYINVLNIVLDFVFVLQFEMGVPGVAYATLIAEWTGLGLGILLCRDAFRDGEWRNPARVLDAARIKVMASVNTDIMIRSALLLLAFTSFQFVASGFGDDTLAANQILLQFLYITAYALDGFAFAAEALVGVSIGALNKAALRRAVVLTSGWGLAVAAVLTAAFLLGGGPLADLMAKSAEVRAEVREYLPWLLAVPILGAPSWMLDGIFVGAARARDMRNAMLQSCAVFGVCAALLTPFFGNHGLWVSMLALFVARGITLGVRYAALEGDAED